ncbi:MAG: hypothetical protein D6730_07925 [Bacteroidetes bacterium]|nr:MAG: hypothetical protein D6730_07925 [Bacteroidota bacterium]
MCPCLPARAQAGLHNQGAHIVVQPHTRLAVLGSQGHYLHDAAADQQAGSLRLQGTLLLQGNWTNLTADTLLAAYADSARVIFQNDSLPQHISGNFPTIFPHLSLQTPAGIYWEAAHQVNGYLQLQAGRILAPSYPVLLNHPDSAALFTAGEQAYIQGKLLRKVQQGTYLFPVGNAAALQLARIRLTAPEGFTWLGMEFVDSLPAFHAGVEVEVAGTPVVELVPRGSWRIWSPQADSLLYDVELEARTTLDTTSSQAGQYALLLFSQGEWQNAGIHRNEDQHFTPAGIHLMRRQLTQTGLLAIGKGTVVLPVAPTPQQAGPHIVYNGSSRPRLWLPAMQQALTLELYTPEGRLWWQQHLSPQAAHLLELPLPGKGRALYLLRIRQPGKQHTLKLYKGQ